MTTDTPRRSTHPGHTHSGWKRQALSFTIDTPKRNRTSSAAIAKAAFCIVLLLLALAGFSAFSRGRQPSHFGSHSPGSALEQLGQPAINELRDCTSTSTSPLCKWVRRHNRANRKRPVDWEPAEGWPEDAGVLSSTHHASDRALTAVEKAEKSPEPLQNIVQSFWPVQPVPGAADTPQSSLPQCAHLHSCPCIAIIGNVDVSHQLQPELQNCTIVQELELVTAANCQHSADVWIASQPLALSALAALTSDIQQCSMQQLLSSTKALWYLGGEPAHIQQLQSQDTGMAGMPAVHFPDTVWNERYNSRPSAGPSADAMQPSALWIGLITILECSSPDTQIHVYPPQPSAQAISLHDVAAERDLLDKLHASGMIVLHQDCSEGVPCIASPDGVSLQGHEGLVAPGIKLYPHRKKWQDSSMRLYNEDEEDEEDES